MKLYVLLEKCNEPEWANHMKMISESLTMHSIEDNEKQRVYREILHLFGGMGSFQDLVLHTGDNMVDDNRVFDALRKELFEAARNQLK